MTNRVLLWIAGQIGRGFALWLWSSRRPLGKEAALLRARCERLLAENELLRARLLRLPPHARPRYRPWHRLAILWHRARYGMSTEAVARAFVISVQTLRNWLEEVGHGVERLVRTRRPANALPALVGELAAYLRREWPRWGTRRIAEVLVRLGLKASRTSVQRMLRHGPRPRRVRASRVAHGSLCPIRPGHIVLIDFTHLSGFFRRITVGAVIDLFSRKVLAIRAATGEPDARFACGLLRECLRGARKPTWVVTDRGRQFESAPFRALLASRSIRHRFGALGRKNSVAAIERFWRSMKEEYGRGLVLWAPVISIDRRLRSYATWFNRWRPHQGLEGRAPHEVYCGQSRRAPTRIESGVLAVRYVDGDSRLPIFRLRPAA